jgi:hypothetical protein
MNIHVESEAHHPDLMKVYDLEELTHSMHDNFREVKSLYNDANEEIFSLSNPKFENGDNAVANDEDKLFSIFKKVRRKLIQINKLMKNYIDNYVVTEKISTDFMKYMAEKNQDKAQEEDFSLTEILDFLKDSSSTRDIQKHEQDLFVMCGLLNSYLLDKQFTLSDDKVASGYYEGTEGESLEQTSKNSIGLSNFIANFGKILRSRIIAGKPDHEIKRVMDTQPVEVNDTDFELYKIPFKNDNQQPLTNGEMANTSLINDLNKSEQTVKRPLDAMLDEAHPDSINLDQDMDDLINIEQEEEKNKIIDQHQDNTVQLVNDDQSSVSNESDTDDDFEPTLSKEELEEKHKEKLEKNEEMFEKFDEEVNQHDNQELNNLESSPISSIKNDDEVSHQTSIVEEDHMVNSSTATQSNVSDSIQEPSHISSIQNEIQSQVSTDLNTQSQQSLHDDNQSQISELNPDQGSSVNLDENALDENNSMMNSMLDDQSQKDVMEGSTHSQDNMSISSTDLQSSLSANFSVNDSQLSNADENKSPNNRKLRSNSLKMRNDKDMDELNNINPNQNRRNTLSRIRMKKPRHNIKLMNKKKTKRERKLNLASFLSRKHKHFRNSRIFEHKSFMPKQELMTRKEKVKQKTFIPISYGHSDRGYINSNIIKKDNSPGYTQEFIKKNNDMKLNEMNRNAFSVYGKKKWYKPKMKIFNDEMNNDLYRGNPMINLI